MKTIGQASEAASLPALKDVEEEEADEAAEDQLPDAAAGEDADADGADSADNEQKIHADGAECFIPASVIHAVRAEVLATVMVAVARSLSDWRTDPDYPIVIPGVVLFERELNLDSDARSPGRS